MFWLVNDGAGLGFCCSGSTLLSGNSVCVRPLASFFNYNESGTLPIASYFIGNLSELWDAGGMPVGAEEQWFIPEKIRSCNSATVIHH